MQERAVCDQPLDVLTSVLGTDGAGVIVEFPPWCVASRWRDLSVNSGTCDCPVSQWPLQADVATRSHPPLPECGRCSCWKMVLSPHYEWGTG